MEGFRKRELATCVSSPASRHFCHYAINRLAPQSKGPLMSSCSEDREQAQVPRNILPNVNVQRALSGGAGGDMEEQNPALIDVLMSHLVNVFSVSPLAVGKQRRTKSLRRRHRLTCHVPDRYPFGSLIRVFMA